MARMQRNLREKLVEEVQKYPMLYNTGNENHRDNEMRDRAWLEISARLGVNSETLKREWKILRDSLRQAIKKQKAEKGKKSKGIKKRWYFESKMAFLLPFMTKRLTVNSSTSDSNAATLEDLKMDGSTQPFEEPASPETVAREIWGGADDDLELFFASVCQCTRRLSRRMQAQVKRQVLDVVLKAEESASEELDQDTKTEVDHY